MAEWRVTLNIEKDGVSIANMPVVRRFVETEDAQLDLTAAADNDTTTYHEIAAATMPTMELLYLTFDQAMNLKINLNTPLPMNAQGLVLILGANLAQATATQNIEYNNPAASITANLTGLVAGT